MPVSHSLEKMWETIVKFGINRKILDPHDEMNHNQLEELYNRIEEKRKDDEQIKLIQDELMKYLDHFKNNQPKNSTASTEGNKEKKSTKQPLRKQFH